MAISSRRDATISTAGPCGHTHSLISTTQHRINICQDGVEIVTLSWQRPPLPFSPLCSCSSSNRHVPGCLAFPQPRLPPLPAPAATSKFPRPHPRRSGTSTPALVCISHRVGYTLVCSLKCPQAGTDKNLVSPHFPPPSPALGVLSVR